MIRLLTMLLAVGALALAGCSDQATNTGATSTGDITQPSAAPTLVDADEATIVETMQISPFKINLQSKGTAESVQAIIPLAFPAGYHLGGFDFTLSFNDEDVTDAYDCYYCYIDYNLIVYFRKTEVLASPVTQSLANTEAVAAVNGYYRLESDSDSYDTWLSKVAMVEIISPSQAVPDPEQSGSESGY